MLQKYENPDDRTRDRVYGLFFLKPTADIKIN
jgi:hypothetical protein